MQKRSKAVVLGAVLLVSFAILASCIEPRHRSQPAEPTPAPAGPAAAEPPIATESTGTPPEDPYSEPVSPLTVRQCGQCHPSIYNALREEGGKHKFSCQDCHQTFHVADQQEAMPVCSDCHHQPHVLLDKFGQCLACHEEPHAPLRIPLGRTVTEACGDCHAGPANELRQAPSAHTKVACASCHHDRHGLIPSCLECHDPHFATQTAPDCLSCHPAHQPRLIGFDAAVDPRTCTGCHAEIYRKWSATPSRHAEVACVDCHTEHARIPECTACHPEPHSEKILAAYPKCLTCHLDAHNPPVKRP